MVYLTGDKEAIRAYERYQMALSDYTSEMNYIRDVGMARGMKKGVKQGMVQGIEQGMAKEKLEVARKMKNAGQPLSAIMEFTGLPKETIEQL